MRIAFTPAAGAVKAMQPKLLGNDVPVNSLNAKPGRGDLRPWKVPLSVATVPAGRKTIYRMGRDVKSDSQYWLSWPTRVHAVRGYDSQDTTERTYYTGDGIPKWTDNTIGLGSAPYPTAWRQLGVPAPTVKPTLTAAGGSSANTETRYYVYTYVTDKGEESAPSPVSDVIACKTDDTVTIASIAAPPSGSFTIDRVRVYVTASGATGATEFFFLREIAAGVASTDDDNRARGAVLETAGWIMPPSDLSHLTGLWNGMLAGIGAGGFRFTPAYVPYAWPMAYEILPPDAKPVAIGAWGQKMLGLTTGKPLLITGTSPDSLDQLPVDGQSCASAAAVVSFPHGVAWPGEDGLSYIGDAGAKLVTAGLLTRDDWQAMNPSGMVAGIYEGAYLCFYTDAQGVRRGFLIDPLNPAGIYFLDTGYEACFFDELQDALYVLDGTNVKKWDAGAAMMTATWRSKVFTTPEVDFPWAAVNAEAYPVTLKVEAGPFKPEEQAALLAHRPDDFTAVGADRIGMSFTATDGKPFNTPDGFTATEWQLEVQTANPVQGVVLATKVEETT